MTKPNKQSPLQVVNDRFGSKKELAKRLSELLEPGPGESKDDLAARLSIASNSKLLHLNTLAEKVAAHGGREGLVQKVAETEKKTGDKDYLTALTEKRTLGWLLDRVEAYAKHERRAKRAS